jgi:hypothetical protein
MTNRKTEECQKAVQIRFRRRPSFLQKQEGRIIFSLLSSSFGFASLSTGYNA